MGRTACTEPQCLYKGALYLFYLYQTDRKWHSSIPETFHRICPSYCTLRDLQNLGTDCRPVNKKSKGFVRRDSISSNSPTWKVKRSIWSFGALEYWNYVSISKAFGSINQDMNTSKRLRNKNKIKGTQTKSQWLQDLGHTNGNNLKSLRFETNSTAQSPSWAANRF